MADRFLPVQSGSDGATRVLTASALPSRPADRFGDFDGESFTLSALRDARPETLVEQLGSATRRPVWRSAPGGRTGRGPRADRPRRPRPSRRSHPRARRHLPRGRGAAARRRRRPRRGGALRHAVRGRRPLPERQATRRWRSSRSRCPGRARRSSSSRTPARATTGTGVLRVVFGDEQVPPGGRGGAAGRAVSPRRRAVHVPAHRLRATCQPAGVEPRSRGRARDGQLERARRLPAGLGHLPDRVRDRDRQRRCRGVPMSRRVDWEFWDGPVGGGTLVESGHFDWPGAISVGGPRPGAGRSGSARREVAGSSAATTARRTWRSRSRCAPPTAA